MFFAFLPRLHRALFCSVLLLMRRVHMFVLRMVVTCEGFRLKMAPDVIFDVLKDFTSDSWDALLHLTPPPPKVRPRAKSKNPPEVRPACRLRTSRPKSKTDLVADARQQHILVHHSYNPRSSVTYLLRFEPRVDRFLLFFERRQPDRCLFSNISCTSSKSISRDIFCVGKGEVIAKWMNPKVRPLLGPRTSRTESKTPGLTFKGGGVYAHHPYLSWGRWIPSWSAVDKSSCLPGSQSGDTKVATQPLPTWGPTSGQLGEITPIVFGVPQVWSKSKEISRIVLGAHLGGKWAR